jgi:hypothetical protein
MDTKLCEACKQVKPLSDFYFRKETGRYRAACKKCKSVVTKEQIAERVNAINKVCKHCGVDKPISEYQKAGGGKWLQPYCKSCDSIRKEKHRKDNNDRYKKLALINYHKNKTLLSDEQKKIGKENRKVKMAVYYDNTRMSPEEKKAKIAACNKSYRERNKEKIIEKRRSYKLSGRATETAKAWQKKQMYKPEFKIKKNLRGRIYVALKRGIKTAATMDLLGCTIEEFKTHIESQFKDGMGWHNYKKDVWHLDHIKPCKLFDLTKESEQRACFHFSNIQPLWSVDNLIKGTKYERTGL